MMVAAIKLAETLKKKNLKIVFAESCTGGMCAATLSQIPGISENLCGGFVVYREQSKIAWLGIDPAKLQNDGAVSAEMSELLAIHTLERTPEADLCASITGHFGPNLPEGAARTKDGVIFIAVALRQSDDAQHQPVVISRKIKLSRAPKNSKNIRTKRQAAASQSVLTMVRSVLTRKA